MQEQGGIAKMGVHGGRWLIPAKPSEFAIVRLDEINIEADVAEIALLQEGGDII
jgi:hypothetical protein